MIRKQGQPSAVRKAAVAGAFYPDNAGVLKSMVTQLLAEAPSMPKVADIQSSPKALIAPHAGYIYSGPVAATAYQQVQRHSADYQRIVLLGPSHRVGFYGVALSGAEYFETPLGRIAVDHNTDKALSDLPFVKVRDDAHLLEHSLEVQLPFLQTIFSDFTLVPLVIGQARAEEVVQVIELLWQASGTLIVISSDLSHFLDYDTAKALDQQTCQAIEALNWQQIDEDQACGRYPIFGLLEFAKTHHWSVTRLGLNNSGDTAGDKNRVVGYGAWAFH